MREVPTSGVTPSAVDARRGVRRSARLSVVAAGLLLVFAIVITAPSPGAVVIGVSLFSVIAWIVVSRVEAFHPFGSFGTANGITLVRAILACLLAAFLAVEALAFSIGAFVIAAVALALDGVDGWVARRSATSSRFGARFDVEIDALLILVLSVAAFLGGKAGAWVLLLGLMRYAFVGASLAWRWLDSDLFPSMRRKSVCVLQIAVLALLLLPAIQPPLSSGLAAAALAALAASFAIDFAWLYRRHART